MQNKDREQSEATATRFFFCLHLQRCSGTQISRRFWGKIMSGQLPWNKYNGICEKWSPCKIMCSEYPDTAIKISRHCHKNKGHKWDLGINLFIVKFGIELYNNCFMNLEQLEYISCLFSFPIYICLFSFPSDEVSQIYEITGWKDTRKALGKCSLNFKTNCLSLFSSFSLAFCFPPFWMHGRLGC